MKNSHAAGRKKNRDVAIANSENDTSVSWDFWVDASYLHLKLQHRAVDQKHNIIKCCH